MAGAGDESNWSKRWQPDEDDRLREAIKKFGEQNWQNVAEFVGTRNLYPCQQRWTLVLKPGIIKGHWSEEEDRKLVYLVSLGLKSWPKIAEGIPGRTPKQCRERWTNCLDPTIKTIPFTEEEDAELLRLQSEIGNKWAEIARSLPGRTENHVKNRFKTLLRQSQLHNIDDQEGHHTPIVILHGLLGSVRNFQTWARILQQMLQYDHDIVCMDLRNHGRSSLYGTMPVLRGNMAEDVLHTLDVLNIQQCHLVGHSMGGKVAALATLQQQHRKVVESLSILDISPVEYKPEDFTHVQETINKLHDITDAIKSSSLAKNQLSAIVGQSFSDPSLAQFILSNVVKTPSGHKWTFNVDALADHLIDVLAFEYSGSPSNVPTLILKAGQSEFVKMSHIEALAKHFPKYGVATVRNAGHWLHFEQPEATAEKVAMFIRAVKTKAV